MDEIEQIMEDAFQAQERGERIETWSETLQRNPHRTGGIRQLAEMEDALIAAASAEEPAEK